MIRDRRPYGVRIPGKATVRFCYRAQCDGAPDMSKKGNMIPPNRETGVPEKQDSASKLKSPRTDAASAQSDSSKSATSHRGVGTFWR